MKNELTCETATLREAQDVVLNYDPTAIKTTLSIMYFQIALHKYVLPNII